MVTEYFPIYEILVESIFGGVGLAILGVALALAIILLVCGTSSTFLGYWMLFYFMVMGTLYIGAIGLIFAFMVGFGITTYNLLKLLAGER